MCIDFHKVAVLLFKFLRGFNGSSATQDCTSFGAFTYYFEFD